MKWTLVVVVKIMKLYTLVPMAPLQNLPVTLANTVHYILRHKCFFS